MNFRQKYLPFAFLAITIGFAPLHAAEPDGRWTPPSADGLPWKHQPTQMAFPPFLGEYRFTGHFNYQENGTLLRYESLSEQARMDIFLFKADTSLLSLEDRHRRILTEMDILTRDMESMVKAGKYKNLNIGEVVGGELELWQKQSLPIATTTLTATRIGISDEGTAEAIVRQWVGITILDDYLITIRQMRPATTGDAGEASMKRVVGLVFQLIKDPALRSHIIGLVDDYMADPFSEHGEQAAAAVLAYLQQTPYFPINIPEDPVSSWMQHCKNASPGTEEHLLRAFMLGGAKAAFAGGDAETCLKEGSRQFAKIYRELVQKHPQISHPQINQFATAAEKGEGQVWMKNYNLQK